MHLIIYKENYDNYNRFLSQTIYCENYKIGENQSGATKSFLWKYNRKNSGERRTELHYVLLISCMRMWKTLKQLTQVQLLGSRKKVNGTADSIKFGELLKSWASIKFTWKALFE
jgi:hypothetical protein